MDLYSSKVLVYCVFLTRTGSIFAHVIKADQDDFLLVPARGARGDRYFILHVRRPDTDGGGCGSRRTPKPRDHRQGLRLSGTVTDQCTFLIPNYGYNVFKSISKLIDIYLS